MSPYFDGGYNTARWASRDSGTIDGFQIETNYTGVRDNAANTRKFTDSLAVVIKRYMDYHFGNLTLPVKLVSFTASDKGDFINLEWSTSGESDIKEFVVERSSDGIGFTEAGRVLANTGSQYGFNDTKYNSGMNYYRLKMKDKDSSYKYSTVTAVNKMNRAAMNIFPNPVGDVFTVSHTKAGRGALLKMFSSSGTLLKSIPIREGSASTSISIIGQPKGVYILAYFNNAAAAFGTVVK